MGAQAAEPRAEVALRVVGPRLVAALAVEPLRAAAPAPVVDRQLVVELALAAGLALVADPRLAAAQAAVVVESYPLPIGTP